MRRIFYISIAIFFTLLQSSFFSVLPYFKFINFILLFLLYLTIKKDGLALPFAIISGYALDIYSSYPFGINILALIIIYLVAQYIYFNLLTNHRFFPVVLLLSLCIIIYHFVVMNALYALSFLKLYEKIKIWTLPAMQNIGLEILYTSTFISIAYLILYLSKKKINTYLLTYPVRSGRKKN